MRQDQEKAIEQLKIAKALKKAKAKFTILELNIESKRISEILKMESLSLKERASLGKKLIDLVKKQENIKIEIIKNATKEKLKSLKKGSNEELLLRKNTDIALLNVKTNTLKEIKELEEEFTIESAARLLAQVNDVTLSVKERMRLQADLNVVLKDEDTSYFEAFRIGISSQLLLFKSVNQRIADFGITTYNILTDSFKTIFFDVLKGDFSNIGQAFKDMLGSMVNSFISALATMAAQAAASTVWNWLTGGISLLGFSKGGIIPEDGLFFGKAGELILNRDQINLLGQNLGILTRGGGDTSLITAIARNPSFPGNIQATGNLTNIIERIKNIPGDLMITLKNIPAKLEASIGNFFSGAGAATALTSFIFSQMSPEASMGSTAGAIVGTFILPGAGTFIGSIIGGAIGSFFGKKAPGPNLPQIVQENIGVLSSNINVARDFVQRFPGSTLTTLTTLVDALIRAGVSPDYLKSLTDPFGGAGTRASLAVRSTSRAPVDESIGSALARFRQLGGTSNNALLASLLTSMTPGISSPEDRVSAIGTGTIHRLRRALIDTPDVTDLLNSFESNYRDLFARKIEASSLPLPSFQTGTSFVPFDMTARLHQGEQVIKAGDNIVNNETSNNEVHIHVENLFAKDIGTIIDEINEDNQERNIGEFRLTIEDKNTDNFNLVSSV